MTKQNKLIVGAVVVLGVYYLYAKNKAKNEVSDLKSGADLPLAGGDRSTLERPLVSGNLENTGGIKMLQEDLKKGQAQKTEMSFDGKKSKSMYSTTF